MVWESMEEKGFISCDNKIGLGKAIPLYLCAGLFDRTDISIDWSPFTLEYMIRTCGASRSSKAIEKRTIKNFRNKNDFMTKCHDMS